MRQFIIMEECDKRQSEGHHECIGERKLLYATLMQAIKDTLDVIKQTPQQVNFLIEISRYFEPGIETLRDDALQWINSNDTDPGSYLWICSMLELNSAGARSWINEIAILDFETRKRIHQQLPTNI